MQSKTHKGLAAAAVFVAFTMSAVAQQSDTTTAAPAPQAQTATTQSATGQPLQPQSKEGFWGHMNPLARKKWVNRQVTPVRDRVNELDELTAKNASEIKDVDSRAQAGIQQATSAASAADQKAVAAGQTAAQAQQLAQTASGKTDTINSTVSGLDQFKPVNTSEIQFRSGSSVLSTDAKASLDTVATQLTGKQGYIVDVQGFTRTRGVAGIQSSDAMADAVVRYLVTEHQIPLYRIHKVALGYVKPIEGQPVLKGGKVEVTLLENSLAASSQPSAAAGSPIGATQQPNQQQPSPAATGAASQPANPNLN